MRCAGCSHPAAGRWSLAQATASIFDSTQEEDLGNIVPYTRVLNGRFGRPRPSDRTLALGDIDVIDVQFRRNGASLANRPHHTQQLASLRVGGRSIMGFRSKKPDGISLNPQLATGWTGKSSGRTEWCRPKTCHRTTSVFSITRSASIHRGSPCPPSEPFT